MSLWWPGEHRAGALLSDRALGAALVAVEQAWLDALVGAGVAPASADLAALASDLDWDGIGVAAESGGTPVMALVAALRERAPEPAARWLHRGLTSQDVLDTAVLLCARGAIGAVRSEITTQIGLLTALARTHRDSPALARTLTQPALPTTFGARVAGWLHGVLDADAALAALTWPVQLGGAAGTLAALVELAGPRAADVRERFAGALGLAVAAPWHTTRTVATRLGDAATTATDGWGRIARDVLELGRAEIGEVIDGSAGGSSTMPHKANPTLAVLVRRAALAAPATASVLHLAAAEQVDERADGAWHAEWPTLALLLRRTVVAAAQTTALLRGLEVRADVMAARLAGFGDTLRAEQRTMAGLVGRAPAGDYLGWAGEMVDEVLGRAAARAEPPALSNPAGPSPAGPSPAAPTAAAATPAAPATAAPIPAMPPEGAPADPRDDLTIAELRAAGMVVRREVLGPEHVDRAAAGITDLTRDFQQFITEYAWGGIWTRPGLERRARSMITLTALVARGHHEELALHLRAARRNGLTLAEIREVLLQAAIYCGVPDANSAFRIAARTLAEDEAP